MPIAANGATYPPRSAAPWPASPRRACCLWYPVKSHARPNAMFAELAPHFAGVALELITTPLTFKKNRLNGSGLVVAGAPPGVVPALSALAAALGPELSLGEGFWQTRGLAWARAAASL
jgi:23S rRNA A2030 N6-methylase RlmJ